MNNNTIILKKKRLQSLKKKSINALTLITETINKLSQNNDAIGIEIEEINDIQNNLNQIKSDLLTESNHNEKIIDRFKSLLEIDE